jgi:hypothetical protein
VYRGRPVHCSNVGMQFWSVQSRHGVPFGSLIHGAEQWDRVHLASAAQHDAHAALNFSFLWTHDETHAESPEMMQDNMHVCIFDTMLENSSL